MNLKGSINWGQKEKKKKQKPIHTFFIIYIFGELSEDPLHELQLFKVTIQGKANEHRNKEEEKVMVLSSRHRDVLSTRGLL